MKDDHKNDWKQGSYKYPLKGSLQAVIDQWKDDRVESWTKPGVPEDIQNIIDDLEENFTSDRPFTKEEILEMVEELAEGVKVASQKLAKSKALQKFGGQISHFYENTDLFRYVEEHLEAYLANDAVEEIRDAAIRLMSLEMELSVIENLILNQAVTDFLRLVTRCYTWGFYAECIIVCRSAMEKAIQDKVNYEMCEKQLGRRLGKRQNYSLEDRIVVAKQESILNDEIAKIATDIRQRGNKVIHEDPKLIEKVRETIKGAIRVISVVTSGVDPFAPPDWLK